MDNRTEASGSSSAIPADVEERSHPTSLSSITRSLSAKVLRNLAAIDSASVVRDEFASIPEGVQRVRTGVPSRQEGRIIDVDVYSKVDGPQEGMPVLLNFHGSGFMIPSLGTDAAFCKFIADKSTYIVLDCDYRKSPEHPFPAAFNDSHDVAHWACERYKPSKIAVSGFSAGATMAMALALSLNSTLPGRVAALAGMYGNADLEAVHDPPSQTHVSGILLPQFLRRYFYNAFLLPTQDRSDPRVSPMNAPLDLWPKDVLLVCGDADNLHKTNELLAEKLRGRQEGTIEWISVPNEAHSFDKKPKEETKPKVDRVYELALEVINRASPVSS